MKKESPINLLHYLPRAIADIQEAIDRNKRFIDAGEDPFGYLAARNAWLYGQKADCQAELNKLLANKS